MDFEAIKRRLCLDAHHKMERFCIIVILLVAVLMSVWGIGMKKKADLEKLYLSSAAVYTTDATFSLTKDKFYVQDLYCDKDRTKAFILMKSAKDKDSMDNLPTDASDYKVFMTADKGSKIEGVPKCGIYIFGSTGYIGLYFVDKAGFSDAMYNIILRNTRIIANGVTPAESGSHWDTFNDLQIFANLNGMDATPAEFLNDEQPDIQNIYSELILKESMEKVIYDLNDLLVDMNSRMYRINDYGRRLREHKIRVPVLPTAIANDYVSDKVEDSQNNPVDFNVTMFDDIGQFLSGNNYYNIILSTDEDGNSDKYKTSDLYLSTNYVFPGGLQVNYQDISIRNGILDKVMPAGMTFQEWYQSKRDEKSEYAQRVDYKLSPTDRWSWEDGTDFVVNNSYITPEEKEIQTLIRQYCNEVNALYEDKKSYQQEKLIEFARYEYEAKNAAGVFSISVSDDNLTLY